MRSSEAPRILEFATATSSATTAVSFNLHEMRGFFAPLSAADP
jgi:hypothetical protein